MSSNGTSFKNNNKAGLGRKEGSKNKTLLEVQRIGEENCLSLYQMHVAEALAGDKECREFLLNKMLPNAKGTRLIELPLPSLEGIDGISKAQDIIISHVARGQITIEEGEKMSSLVEQKRKIIESSEVMKIMEELQSRVKGIEEQQPKSV